MTGGSGGTLELVQHGPGGTPIHRLDISQPGLHPIGRDATASRIELTSPLLQDQHFAIRHDGNGLALLVRGATRLNGHAITGEALLAHLDRIEAGPYLFTVACPDTAPYARGRVKDTLWAATAAAESWTFLDLTGLHRAAGEGFNEVIAVAQDELGGFRGLEDYIGFQHSRMARQLQDFRPQVFGAEPLYGGSEARLTVATMTFMDQPAAQLQYFGVHGGRVAIAAWMVPPGTGTRDEAFAAFGTRLRSYMHFH